MSSKESCIYKYKRACSSVDRAFGCGPKGRRSDSCQAHRIKLALVAQWIERLVPVQKAIGPIPVEGTHDYKLIF